MTFELLSLVTVAFCVLGVLATLYLEWRIDRRPPPAPMPRVKPEAGWRERKTAIIDSGWRKKDDL